MRAALSGLRGRFDIYVYISSDSIYEVSACAAEGWSSFRRDPPVVAESVGVRPAGCLTQCRLRWADAYGHGKLEAEEVLASSLVENPAAGSGVSIRLPDVIGPFDDTLRLWAYWHWLQAGKDKPV